MHAVARFALAAALVAVASAAAAQNTVIIRSLESRVVVHAQFNPTEITITKSVPWQKHKNSEGDAPTLEFTAAEPKTLQAELSFDTANTGADVHDAFIAPLEALALIDPAKRRPPLVQFEWGSFPPFRGVVESVGVRYTLFLPDGTPTRATASITLRQADHVLTRKRGDPGTVISCQVPEDCPSGQSCFNGACAPAQ